MTHRLPLAAAALLLAPHGTAMAQTAPMARPSTFAICASCHTTDPKGKSYGPSLAGVAGRKAGSFPGYAYSDALKASGLSWNSQTLDRWLTSPQKTVPGTKMPFTGIPDATKRKEVVDYLLTLK